MSPSLFLVFSATPYRMGRAIRVVTHSEYNHVSLALSAQGPLYSFARKHCNAPFFGGFVKESPLRYRNRDRNARILVCRIPVTEEQYEAVKIRLAAIEAEEARYVYNLFSAAAAPVHRRVPLPRSYTCVEFVVSLLAEGHVLSEDELSRFWSVDELAERFASCTAYQGTFPKLEEAQWQDDSFPVKSGRVAAVLLTGFVVGQLTYRLLKKYKNT